jgi:SsrA-binding protein
MAMSGHIFYKNTRHTAHTKDTASETTHPTQYLTIPCYNYDTLMKKITNKKAYFDFFIKDTLEAGMQLTGAEVKSIKSGRIKLDTAFVRIIGGEAYLVNADVQIYEKSRPDAYDPQRTRKLLLRRKQIIALETKMTQQKLTIVPVSCYTSRNLVKLSIGLAKRKKNIDKRAKIQKRDMERETRREFRRK